MEIEKTLTEFVNEGVQDEYNKMLLTNMRTKNTNTNPIFFVTKGMNKAWVEAINRAIKISPKDSIPEFIGNFASFTKAVDRKFGKRDNSKYGVSLEQNSIDVPSEYMTTELFERWKKRSGQSAENLIRLMEIKVDYSVDSALLNVNNVMVVGFNTRKYKSPKQLVSQKHKINNSYIKTSKSGRNYHVNFINELDTIVHEFGHIFDKKKRISSGATWTELHRKWVYESAPDVCKSVSEAFAEAFANYIVNKSNNIPVYIKTFLKQTIK